MQTVKMPGGAGLFDRDEWEGPVAGPELDTARLDARSPGRSFKTPAFASQDHRLAADITAETQSRGKPVSI